MSEIERGNVCINGKEGWINLFNAMRDTKIYVENVDLFNEFG